MSRSIVVLMMSTMQGHVLAMGPFDVLALVIASTVLAFGAVGELKDITRVGVAVQHAGDTLSNGWRFVFGFLSFFRRWVCLPLLIVTGPALVGMKGADALNICLNTVAILVSCARPAHPCLLYASKPTSNIHGCVF